MTFKKNLIGIFLFSLSPLSLQAMPECPSESVLCTHEYIESLKQSDSIVEALIKLPTHVKRNLTLKRGTNIEKDIVGYLGPHGHLVSRSNSGSASPEQPRVIVWDEESGLTVSWNSGNPAHNAHDRIDLYDFDFENKKHRLMAWFPNDKEKIHDGNFLDHRGKTCKTCHGDVERPIFPMYPDWPQFYGEFNDELAGYAPGKNALRIDLKAMGNDYQAIERKYYADFLSKEAKDNPRYSLLYEARTEKDLSNPYYPFRPDNTTSPFSSTSRAFAHRPNLRLGVVYNRLVALQSFEKIKASPIFQKFPDIMLYSLLDCNWDFVEGKGQKGRQDILGKLLEELKKKERYKNITLRGARYSHNELTWTERRELFKEGDFYYYSPAYSDEGYRQIPYEDLLAMLDLNIADIDIRFMHNTGFEISKETSIGRDVNFSVYDPRAYAYTSSVMDIGYINEKYEMNPICDNQGSACEFSYKGTYMEGMRYFNSYFDGSATTNELLAAQMLLYLINENESFVEGSDLDSVRDNLRSTIRDPYDYFETLGKKYQHYTARLELDKKFFERMDSMSPWIQLPYPPDLLNVHNREAFWGSGQKTSSIREKHAQWMTAQERKDNVQNRNGGKNLCWNVYTSMHRRYRIQNN